MTTYRLNAAQIACKRVYGRGDFNHVAEVHDDAAAFRRAVNDVGDTLFLFLMIELAASEDCDSNEEALRRLEMATHDIYNVTSAIARLDTPADVLIPG